MAVRRAGPVPVALKPRKLWEVAGARTILLESPQIAFSIALLDLRLSDSGEVERFWAEDAPGFHDVLCPPAEMLLLCPNIRTLELFIHHRNPAHHRILVDVLEQRMADSPALPSLHRLGLMAWPMELTNASVYHVLRLLQLMPKLRRFELWSGLSFDKDQFGSEFAEGLILPNVETAVFSHRGSNIFPFIHALGGTLKSVQTRWCNKTDNFVYETGQDDSVCRDTSDQTMKGQLKTVLRHPSTHKLQQRSGEPSNLERHAQRLCRLTGNLPPTLTHLLLEDAREVNLPPPRQPGLPAASSCTELRVVGLAFTYSGDLLNIQRTVGELARNNVSLRQVMIAMYHVHGAGRDAVTKTVAILISCLEDAKRLRDLRLVAVGMTFMQLEALVDFCRRRRVRLSYTRRSTWELGNFPDLWNA